MKVKNIILIDLAPFTSLRILIILNARKTLVEVPSVVARLNWSSIALIIDNIRTIKSN